jgi:hypothetical protein
MIKKIGQNLIILMIYLCGFVVFVKYHRWSGLGLAASGRQNSLYLFFYA